MKGRRTTLLAAATAANSALSFVEGDVFTRPLPSRTDWTRLVPPPVLNGHALSFARRLSDALRQVEALKAAPSDASAREKFLERKWSPPPLRRARRPNWRCCRFDR